MDFIRFKKSIPQNVNIIAVSKTKPVEKIKQIYDLGHKDFGENKVQELIKKHEELPDDINWHLIGKLQRNKVKYIAPFIHLIHSVDSEKLLSQINKEGDKNNRIINVLLQIKISNDPLKTGFDFSELEKIISSDKFLEYKFVKVLGFMGMGSIDQSKNEEEFRKISNYFNKTSKIYDLKYLSLGMSNDYKLAIKYNSNMIRIGSLIFGFRN
ncbi:MAG: YggS family pyridoxal phosphate-dependent enzyme [Cryomorphaceae bacterium MED-G14]|nr:MAG: YggS family pyridoxal phosphate-dependent enzyme [Cryomorphaceae bacterium MED-G14]|tara:strand:- start:945 stop:1577 length:633 start_codon:yes stop_codon:yes gene_type:complete